MHACSRPHPPPLRLPGLEAGLEQVERERADALLTASVPLYRHLKRIVAFAATARLPDVYMWPFAGFEEIRPSGC